LKAVAPILMGMKMDKAMAEMTHSPDRTHEGAVQRLVLVTGPVGGGALDRDQRA
jgi:hypothetical protein